MRSLTLTTFIVTALCLGANASHAQGDGHANSYCLEPNAAWDSTVWTVSSDMASLFTPSAGHTPISTVDLIRFYDTNMQYMTRMSRARVRTRISSTSTQCEPDQPGVACITANGDEDPKCNPAPRPACSFGWLCGLGETCESGQCVKSCTSNFDCRLNVESCQNNRCELIQPIAYAGCAGGFGGSCKFVICASPSTNKAFNEEALSAEDGSGLWLTRHELGHAFGLDHCQACEGSTTSDGCSGEIMAKAASLPPRFTFGDARGLRVVYGNENLASRPVQRLAWNSLTGTTFPAPTDASTSFASVYPQRLDCKDGAGVNTGLDCARARPYLSGTTRRVAVSRLVSPMLLSGQWTNSSLADFAVSFHGPVDIAVHHDGRQVFLGLTRSLQAGEQWVYRIDGFDGSLTAIQMPYANGNDAAQLPVRVTHLRGRDALAVWSYSGNEPTLRVRLVEGLNTSSPTVSNFVTWNATGSSNNRDLDGDDSIIVADFDVDCRFSTEKVGSFFDREYDDCLIVAPRLHRAEGAGFDGRVASRRVRFTRDKIASTNTVSVLTPWEYAPSTMPDSSSVTAVALSGARLVVSTTQRSAGSNPVNRLSLFSGITVGSGFIASRVQTADFGTACTSATSFGQTVGGQTLSGSIPIAWCPTCGSGQFEGFAWGGPDASGFCH